MKLVILDRDGTINHDSDQYIKSTAEFRTIKGSVEAIARLSQAGYRVVVATNQSGIARGLFDTATLISMHDMLQRAVSQAGGRIDAFFFCPHAADSGCECRKPKPGMLLEIARQRLGCRRLHGWRRTARCGGGGGGGRASGAGAHRQRTQDA
jgi:D-glycero-D-manno-heptose 1,7-bisphosphate phosphatase